MIQPQDIIALALTGDSAAMVVYQELVDILTLVICNIAVLLDPEMIMLGGLASESRSMLIPAIMAGIGNALLRLVHLTSSELDKNALIMEGAIQCWN